MWIGCWRNKEIRGKSIIDSSWVKTVIKTGDPFRIKARDSLRIKAVGSNISKVGRESWGGRKKA